MKLLLLVAVLLVVLYAATATVGRVCTNPDDCDQNECCQRLSLFPVASRKRQLDYDAYEPEGTCQRVIQRGQSCDSISIMNGYCGCAQGLRCQTVRESKRGALPPGFVQRCL